jgi:hypothetical protein
MALKGRQVASKIDAVLRNPVGYTPTPVNLENADQVSAHLQGIDIALTKQERLATIPTTNNTVTTIVIIPIPDNSSVLIEASIVGKQTNGLGRAGYIREALVYRNNSSNATLQNTVNTLLTRESTASWDANIAVNGFNAIITVQGATGNAITWVCRYKTTTAI